MRGRPLTKGKPVAIVLSVVGAALLVALATVLVQRASREEAWSTEVEGFLAVPTPCCSEATIWKDLDRISEDGQQARPATPAEAARWLNTWPYREREAVDEDGEPEQPLLIAVQNTEVRCVGKPTGAEVPQHGDDAETVRALRRRQECVFTKWKIWSEENTEPPSDERHTVWADEEGRFHGRVDYWR